MPGRAETLTAAPFAQSGAPAVLMHLRVLAVIAAESVSGPARQLASLVAPLSSQGIELEVAIPWRVGRPRPDFASHLERHGVPTHLIEDRGPLDFRLADRLSTLVRDRRCDVLQTHSYKATAAAWWLRRRGLSVPWIGFYHGHTTETLRAHVYHRLDRAMLLAADRVVVMSERQRQQFPRAGDRIQIVHNAVVDLPQGSRPLPPSPPRVATRSRIGVIGRLSPEKGVDIFLDACTILLERGMEFDALIVGDGVQRERLEKSAAALGLLNERVHFLGHLPASRALYEDLDLVVIPSRTEGLPNVLLEAIGVGRLVVATNVGAIPEVLGGTRAGILVQSGDAASLAAAIEDALTISDQNRVLDDQAALRDRFSLERRAAAHANLYRTLIAARDATMAQRPETT